MFVTKRKERRRMENMDDLHEQGVVCRIFPCFKLRVCWFQRSRFNFNVLINEYAHVLVCLSKVNTSSFSGIV